MGVAAAEAGPAGLGFPPDPDLSHQPLTSQRAGSQGRRTPWVGRRSEPERWRSHTFRFDEKKASRRDHQPPGPRRPDGRGTWPPAPTEAASRTPTPRHLGPPPRRPQPSARKTERRDPRRHRHRRPRGLARRPPRVATREVGGGVGVAARRNPSRRPSRPSGRRGGWEGKVHPPPLLLNPHGLSHRRLLSQASPTLEVQQRGHHYVLNPARLGSGAGRRRPTPRGVIWDRVPISTRRLGVDAAGRVGSRGARPGRAPTPTGACRGGEAEDGSQHGGDAQHR